MSKHSFSPDEEAEKTMSALDGILRAGPDAAAEERLMKHFDDMQRRSSLQVKWFRAAAVFLFLVNVAVAVVYLRNGNAPGENAAAKPNDTYSLKQVGQYFFQGGSSWY